MIRICLALFVAAMLAWSRPAHAAQSLDACTRYINALPATLGAPGTWCLRHDLAYTPSTGDAITVASDGVTIDCNDFVISGVGTATTSAIAIKASQRRRTTVRHCDIRGFHIGVFAVSSSAGYYVVEDDTFDDNLCIGVDVQGDQSIIRRNRILDTGGSSSGTCDPAGIDANGVVDVLDNIVSGVVATSGSGQARGIEVADASGPESGSVERNRVDGVLRYASGSQPSQTAIELDDTGRMTVRDNELSAVDATGTGILCFNSTGPVRAKDNILTGFAIANSGCANAGGNDASH